MNNRFRSFCALALLTASLAFAGELLDSVSLQNIELDSFKTCGVVTPSSLPQEQNDLPQRFKWLLSGRRATVSMPLYKLRGLELQIIGNDDYSLLIQSPACIFDQTSRLITSSSVLFLTNPHIAVSGIGYDIFLREDDVVVSIRQAVKITFNRPWLEKFKDLKHK